MSVSTCALSGLPLENPVVCVKTGHVFERDLIKKQIQHTGQCPLTGVDLSFEQDFIELQVSQSALPKPPVANNIPGVLQMLQSEWDNVMLEVFQLRKSLEQTRRELSQALYQHDAACRVICRLMKEKDELQNVLKLTSDKMEQYKSELASQVVQGGSSGQGYVREEKEDEGIYKELVNRMDKLSDELLASRKHFKAPVSYPKLEEYKQLKQIGSFPLHESTKPGILDLDINSLDDRFILTGGRDSKVILFDRKEGQILKKLEPFDSKKKPAATVAKFVPGQNELYSLVGSADGEAAIWALDYQNNHYQEKYAFKHHKSAITGMTFQALNEYAVVGSKDKTWSFHSLFQGVRLATVQEQEEVHSVEFHPDGLVLAVGLKNGAVKIYDIRTQQSVLEFADFKGQGEVKSLSFSNKGVQLAAGWSNMKECKVFSLRKTNEVLSPLNTTESNSTQAVSFDHYGGYLLTGSGNVVNIYGGKQLREPTHSIVAHEGIINVAKFSPQGSLVVSGAEDRFLKIHSL
ncbi:UNKNOWN [Stylonychia lemnae]|uniref:Pre-mRNA-processing factor 19 n=1 Tax=Stylonychia lemnae TaxID=5949 RepID=A0A077ZSI1_STYLE|nr:UNKNOWN [Stylonychia lemnae]|eukprot:CDW72817.1 UNKNOWN [Stylonychia lemnae]